MFTLLLPILLATATVFSENVTIETLLGNVIGEQKDGFIELKGIPFAENAPIDDRRLTAAELKTSPYSMDPFPALSFGPSCIQYNPWDTTLGELSEDCLYINIYTPASFNAVNGSLTSTGELLPVMVWIYGGAFVVGSSSQYNGDAFMENKNLILVTFNYRIGPLGFLSLRSIYDETNGKTTGGMNGLNDQIVALQWIQMYIEDYGGDPDRVTVFGESAGGFSGCFLSLMPEAAGLADQIVIQSGLCAPPHAEPQPFETGIASSIAALSYVGLSDNITEIRAADVSVFFTIGYFVQPAVDGYLLKDTAFNMLDTNNFTITANKIIIGTVSLDTTVLWPWFAGAVPNPTNEREFNGYLEQYVSNETQQELLKNTYYPLSDFPSAMYDGGDPTMTQTFTNYTMRWGTISADCCWTCGALWYAKKLTENKATSGYEQLYVYNFIGPSDADYIPHGSDVGYIFYNDGTNVNLESIGVPEDIGFIDAFQDIWHNFAIYNVPNSTLVNEQWLPYDETTKSVYMIGTNRRINKGWYNIDDFMSSGYRNGVCDFWIDEIGWDTTSAICLGLNSLPPTGAPTPESIDIGDNLTVTTQLGDVQGIQNDGFIEFKGIPFVENQPIGDYRYTEAELKTSSYSMSPFPALSFGPSCIQAPDPTVGIQSEDCLYINIYTPNVSPDEALPVMVWIYGGGFATGSSTQYRADAFMNDENVILVTFNYRIGALGFLSLESIYNETNGRTTGGMNGINDQIVALQWVQNYISDFGGDPDQVTIFGESAGGFSGCFLSLIPKAAGLFDQVIIQSGHCSPNWGSQNEYEAGITASVTSLSYVGLTDNLAQIRAADASLFVSLFPQLSVDRYILHDTTQNMLLNNDYTLNGNKFIIGTVSLDTLLLYPWYVGLYPAPTNEMEFNQLLKQYIPDEAQQELVKSTYYPISDFPESIYYGDDNDNDPVTYSNYTMRWGTMSADVCWKCANLWYAQKLAENNADRELYVYDFIGPEGTNYIPHGADVAYMFYNGTNETETTSGFAELGVPKDLEFSRLFQNVWINFGLYGMPDSSMLNEQWLPYDAADGNGYILGNDGAGNENYNVANFYTNGYRNGACEFWINEIGWDTMGYLCLNVYSVEPTESPTINPSQSPTMNTITPTENPTTNPTINAAKHGDDESTSSEEATTWMIVAITFIILFSFALIIIIYQCYSSSNKDGYSQPPKPSGLHEPVDSKDVTEMAGNGGRTDGMKYDI